jgi:hypothetical protein
LRRWWGTDRVQLGGVHLIGPGQTPKEQMRDTGSRLFLAMRPSSSFLRQSLGLVCGGIDGRL